MNIARARQSGCHAESQCEILLCGKAPCREQADMVVRFKRSASFCGKPVPFHIGIENHTYPITAGYAIGLNHQPG